MALRIGHVVPTYLPRSETFTFDLIRAMPGAEHRIFTTRVENLELFPTSDLVRLASEEDYPAAAARHGVDLLVGHFGPSGLAALPAALLNGIPLVTVFHGYDVSLLLRDPRWVARYHALFRFGAHAVCIARAGRTALAGIGCPPGRVSVIHLGVDVERFGFRERARRAADPLNLLMVSRLAAKKGVHVALEALRRRLDAGARDTLRVLGDGELREALHRLRSRLGLDDAVRFEGPASSDDVRRAMAVSDVLLQPSVTAPDGDAEGIPVVLMEAMASGVPVIATRHSGIPELVSDRRSGLLVPERDSVALAHAIGELGASPALARALAVAARRTVERNFNLATQARKLALLLEDIARRSPTGVGARPGAVPDGADTARGDFAGMAGRAASVLFIRSSPVTQSLTHLDAIARRRPALRIWVLTTAATAELFERCPLVARVLRYAAPRLSAASLEPQTLAAIRAARFDRIYISAATPDGRGYGNVETLARACGAPAVVLLPTLEERPIESDLEACSA